METTTYYYVVAGYLPVCVSVFGLIGNIVSRCFEKTADEIIYKLYISWSSSCRQHILDWSLPLQLFVRLVHALRNDPKIQKFPRNNPSIRCYMFTFR